MYLILSISLLGSIFYILFKILEKFLKNNLKSKSYYNILKIISLAFIIPISYILSLYMPNIELKSHIPIEKTTQSIQDDKKLNVISQDIKPISFNTDNVIDNELEIENENKIENISVTDSNYKEKLHFNINYIKTLYLIGILLFVFMNLAFFIKFKLIIKKSNYILNDEYNKVLDKTKEKLNINKNILLLENKNVFSPMLVGIIKPKIILPIKEISIEDLELILTHELIHFKRKDLITKLVLLFVNILNFFNPLIYFLIKDIDKYCEYSCDDKLIKIYNENKEKAYCLAILNSINPNKNTHIHFSTTFACNRKNLKRRLENIMTKDKPKNKLKITLASVFFTFTCIIFILIFSIYYSNNKSNVFAKEKLTINRTFEEPVKIKDNEGNRLIDGKEVEIKTNILPEFEKDQVVPSVRLKGTFIKEEPSIGNLYLDFAPRKYFGTEGSTDKYIKIELENIGKHKDDKDNTFDLTCLIFGKYYNNDSRNMEKQFLGEFKVPKNQKVTYVFENIPNLNGYELGFVHKNSYAPSFNIEVTTAYNLEDLGASKISNLYNEKTEFLKYTDGQRLNDIPNKPDSTYTETYGGGKRIFDLDSGFYKNLNLKLDNKTNDEYLIFMYDVSTDIYSDTYLPISPIYKEYTVKANSVFDETITNTLLKEYYIHIVPKALREDYLKLQDLKEKLTKEAEEKGINNIYELNSKTKEEYEKLGKEYYDKYEQYLQKQEGTIYYKFFN